MTTKESESMKRLMALDRIAGPDDPIYQSGVAMVSIRRLKIPMFTGQEMRAIVERLRRDPKYKQ